MNAMQWGNLAYLGLLGAVLVSWFVIQNRQSLSKTVQQAAAWGLIFLGVIAVIGIWDDISQTVRPSQSVLSETNQIELPRAPDGHFYATLQVNGAPVRFMVDTGASAMVLSKADAREAGLDLQGLDYFGRAVTANGEVRTAPVRLETVALGPFTDRDFRASVTEGDLDQSLLGMSYLQLWRHIEISDGALRLTR